MYKGYNFSAGSYDFYDDVNQYDCDIFYEGINRKVVDSLSEFYFDYDIFNDFVIDGTKMQNFCFPLSEQHIFLSHSHDDIELVKRISYILKHYLNLDVFVDSFIWSYADDLLQLIDDKYCYQPKKKTYNYKLRNFSTSHVHMMLNNALQSMIDNCECLFFVNTKNSINEYLNNTGTYSPWIMSEIQFSSVVRRKMNRSIPIRESFAQDHAITAGTEERKLNVLYSMNTNHLTDIGKGDFVNWINESNRYGDYGYEALSRLYQKY